MLHQASCLIVFLSGIGINFAMPPVYGRFDPDRILEGVYNMRTFNDDVNPVDIAGPRAWEDLLSGFKKFAPAEKVDLPDKVDLPGEPFDYDKDLDYDPKLMEALEQSLLPHPIYHSAPQPKETPEKHNTKSR